MSMELVEAGRPENEDEWWIQQYSKDGFTECDSCGAKPGSPVLCHGCLCNRTTMGKYKDRAEKLEVENKKLNETVRALKELLKEAL